MIKKEMTDKQILDWLEDNIAYVMIGADITKGRFHGGTLKQTPEDDGKGWNEGILRRAVMQAAKNEKK